MTKCWHTLNRITCNAVQFKLPVQNAKDSNRVDDAEWQTGFQGMQGLTFWGSIVLGECVNEVILVMYNTPIGKF